MMGYGMDYLNTKSEPKFNVSPLCCFGGLGGITEFGGVGCNAIFEGIVVSSKLELSPFNFSVARLCRSFVFEGSCSRLLWDSGDVISEKCLLRCSLGGSSIVVDTTLGNLTRLVSIP